MAEKRSVKKTTQRSAKRTTASTSKTFTADERAAMKARAQELRAEERANKDRADGERDLLAAIAQMKAGGWSARMETLLCGRPPRTVAGSASGRDVGHHGRKA